MIGGKSGTAHPVSGAPIREHERAVDAPNSMAPCDGGALLAALRAASTWLEGHRAAVDALNVFPVPDGDTGTNMSMTLNAALREAEASPALDSAGAVAERAAYGALMGARGNSGVILSQLLRGFAHALRGRRHIDAAELAGALSAAAETAGRAVMKPVEGTILTVSTAAGHAAARAAARGANTLEVLDAALAEATAAVARTPDQMPLLKQAGVVDAGAEGYALILEGVSRHVHGQSVEITPVLPTAGSLHVAHVAHGDDYGYCTEFVVVGPGLDEASIRDAIGSMGDSTLVVGEEGIVRVHVHTEDPGRILSYAAPLGQLHRIKIESMQDQHDRFVARAASLAPGPHSASDTDDAGRAHRPGAVAAAGQTGIVAVAPGPGLADVFRSLGAGAVVPGGQTMNPSTAEILDAIDALPQDAVLVLPNNGNVMLVAGQARELSRKAVRVIPARTVPQGMAALVAYLPDADTETNAAAMAEAADGAHTGEVTIAVRDATLDGIAVHAGDALGLLDGEAVSADPDRTTVALAVIERLGVADAGMLTLFYGQDVTAEEAGALAGQACRRYGSLEVEVVSGGQPHYPYIMSVE